MDWEAAGGAVGAVAVGAAFTTVGLALARDYRGFTAWHVRTSLRLSHPLSSIPPWRWLPERLKDKDAQYRRFYRLDRAIGWVFAAAGVLACVTGIVALISAGG